MTYMLRYKGCLQWAGALLAAAAAACAGAASAARADACAAEYSVINLGPAGRALLNQRGQVAFTSAEFDSAGSTVLRYRFFDGSRVQDHGAFEENGIILSGMNRHGAVVGQLQSSSLPSSPRAFSWTSASGLRLLPSPASAGANAINDRDQVAGWLQAPPVSARAVRWNSDRSLTSLGPLPPDRSEAFAINRHGVSAGVVYGGGVGSRAMIWDAAGAATDLGFTPGGENAAAYFINANGEAAGGLNRQTQRIAFYWSRERGMLPIAPAGGRSVFVTALNDNGDIGGNVVTSEAQLSFAPFVWSLKGGSRLLPVADAATSYLSGMNNHGEIVGSIQPSRQDGSTRRAAYWSGQSDPVDLNTRLYRPPPGLILHAATAVTDKGVILADSNAGLVLLRPGRDGTAAPVLGPVTGIPSSWPPVAPNSTLDFAVAFVDSSAGESHVASASVNDGCPQQAPSLREARGIGEVNLRHTFCRAGAFTIKVRVTDRAGNATEVAAGIFVADPAVAAVFGQGELGRSSDRAAAPGTDGLQFAVWVPLSGNAAPAHFTVRGSFYFIADEVGTPERIGDAVRFSGTGRFNGRPGYRFQAEALARSRQRGDAYRLRLRISRTEAATNAEVVEYDNRADGSGIGTAISEGTLRLVE